MFLQLLVAMWPLFLALALSCAMLRLSITCNPPQWFHVFMAVVVFALVVWGILRVRALE